MKKVFISDEAYRLGHVEYIRSTKGISFEEQLQVAQDPELESRFYCMTEKNQVLITNKLTETVSNLLPKFEELAECNDEKMQHELEEYIREYIYNNLKEFFI